MDLTSKRNLWSLLLKYRSLGKSVVLASRSIDDCEALSTRLAIMVNGELKCIGSKEHLRNKFSKGFALTIKIVENDWDE